MPGAPATAAEASAANSRRTNSRAVSKPPSIKIAPSTASNASASVDGALAPAVSFLAAAQNQMRAQPQRAGACSASARRLTSLARAFVSGPSSDAGKFFVKLLRQDEPQHRVAEKFQPLVVRGRHAVFMRDGRMRERKAQQIFVAESVAETVLKCGEVGHGNI